MDVYISEPSGILRSFSYDICHEYEIKLAYKPMLKYEDYNYICERQLSVRGRYGCGIMKYGSGRMKYICSGKDGEDIDFDYYGVFDFYKIDVNSISDILSLGSIVSICDGGDFLDRRERMFFEGGGYVYEYSPDLPQRKEMVKFGANACVGFSDFVRVYILEPGGKCRVFSYDLAPLCWLP